MVKRVNYLDSAKGIGMIFVVLFHIITALMVSDPKPFMPYVIRYIVTIALPIFFISSGMLLQIKGSDNRGGGTIVKRKAKSLLIPYVSFCAIVIALDFVKLILGLDAVTKTVIIRKIVFFALFRGFSVFWFLPTLFFAEIIFIFLKRKANIIVMYSSIVLGLLAVLFFCRYLGSPFWTNGWIKLIAHSLLLVIGRVFLALAFLLVGYLAMHILENEKMTRLKISIISIVLLISQYFLSYKVGGTDINTLTFGNSFFFFASAVVGSLGMISLFKAIPDTKIISKIGKESLIIMATHLDFGVIAIATFISYKLIAYIPRAKDLFLYIMIFSVVIIMEIFYILIFNKFLYKLIGKDKLVKKSEKR